MEEGGSTPFIICMCNYQPSHFCFLYIFIIHPISLSPFKVQTTLFFNIIFNILNIHHSSFHFHYHFKFMGMADIQTKRKIFILGACGLLLIVLALSVAAAVVNSQARAAVHTHESVIRSACAATLYPDLCFSTVKDATSAASSSVKSPKDVLLTALNYVINAVQHNYVTVKKLAAASRNLTPREKVALSDCLELIDDTLDELRKSEAELKDYGFKNYTISQHKHYLMTLLSAAQTNQGTCLDGFSGSKADKKVREGLIAGQRHVFRLVSNVLAMIKNISDTELAALSSSFAAVNSSSQPERRLGEDGWPEWLSARDRRLLQGTTVTPDVTVAADGSGNYRTVAEAVAAAPSDRDIKNRYVIKIKKGVYREKVTIPNKKTYLMFVGDGRMDTIITAKMNTVDDGITTFHTATVAVEGWGFLARDITFENSAGPSKHQAVALRVNADESAFYRCGMQGFQDTLYVHSLRQFYTNCVIVGTVDFIFGNAEVHIQNSDIHARLPRAGQKNMVTAQNRDDPNQNTGIIIQSCRIAATSDLEQDGSVETYLGRPWGNYSRTVIMQTEISNVIHPAGWHEWNDVDDYKKDQAYYAEHRNTGPGADTTNRVTWGGVKPQITEEEAEQFTAENFIDGETWLPATGFPHILGFK